MRGSGETSTGVSGSKLCQSETTCCDLFRNSERETSLLHHADFLGARALAAAKTAASEAPASPDFRKSAPIGLVEGFSEVFDQKPKSTVRRMLVERAVLKWVKKWRRKVDTSLSLSL